MGNAESSKDLGVTYQGHFENKEDSLRSGQEAYTALDNMIGGKLSPAHRLVGKEDSKVYFVVEYKHKENNVNNETIFIITNKVANSLWEGTVTLTKEGNALDAGNKEVSISVAQWKEFQNMLPHLIINTP